MAGQGCGCTKCREALPEHNPAAVLMSAALRAAYEESRRKWREDHPPIDVKELADRVERG